MPRYRVQYPDVPWEDRAKYPASVQQQLDQRIVELMEDPRARARYYPGLRRYYWITTFGPNHDGEIVYFVRDEPIPTMGILDVSYMGFDSRGSGAGRGGR